MPEAVRPANAPVPRNAAERLVFAQLYRRWSAGCDGRIEPTSRRSGGRKTAAGPGSSPARRRPRLDRRARDRPRWRRAGSHRPSRRRRLTRGERRTSAVTVLTADRAGAVTVPSRSTGCAAGAGRGTAAEVGGWPAARPPARRPASRQRPGPRRARSAGTAPEFRRFLPTRATPDGGSTCSSRDPAVNTPPHPARSRPCRSRTGPMLCRRTRRAAPGRAPAGQRARALARTRCGRRRPRGAVRRRGGAARRGWAEPRPVQERGGSRSGWSCSPAGRCGGPGARGAAGALAPEAAGGGVAGGCGAATGRGGRLARADGCADDDFAAMLRRGAGLAWCPWSGRR